MIVRFGQAAMLAAILVLTMNSARAEDPPAKGAGGACCKDVYDVWTGVTTVKCGRTDGKCADCCKDKNCCKADNGCKTACKCESCCKDGKCCKDGTCCKGSKCCKDGTCCESKQCCKGACGCSCCAPKSKQTKKAAVVGPIIVVMPAPMAAPAMPVHFGCPACSGMPMACPMLPPGLTPQSIAMPVPPPPPPACYGCPATGCCPAPILAAPAPHGDANMDTCMSLLGLAADLCSSPLHPPSLPSMCVSAIGLAVDLFGENSSPNMTIPSGQYLQHPPQYVPSSPIAGPGAVAILPPPTPCDSPYCCSPQASPMVTCSAASPAPAATKVRIVAKPNSDQLEMSVSDDTCMTCKKMVVKVGDSSLTLTRIEGQVRVRAADFKAKADCVRTDRKDHVILQGDVELHYSKDGQCAKVTAECIKLNLTTGSVMIESAGSLERIGVNCP